MRRSVLAAVLVLLAAGPGWAGEGNGPNFPGQQRVNVGVTTTFPVVAAPARVARPARLRRVRPVRGRRVVAPTG